ncbi:MAG TPA: entericidin EcnA/B family protein [Coxiellaceae bacterium]|nr:entericidin EcnA/B family protein [Coxiellaceae bacterium]
MKIKLIAISAALVGALFLSACHTAAGAGQDIEQGGQAIQRAVS